ncbi:MAG: gamma-glutamyltransferase [Planctomycetota bacterium]|nr:gamma-glutamyltransferase [Planctomycetota bacterium]
MSQAAIIVASSDQSARAGADIIRAGGNVIDAAIAAAFATSAGEPSITSLAGGAVMVHRDASRGTVEIYDLFSNAPGLGKTAESVDFSGVDIYFPEGDTTQTFHIGRGAAAVPATLRGLCNILHKRGRLELGEVLAPVIGDLEEGIEVQDYQVACFRYLEEILKLSQLGRDQFFGSGGKLLEAGDTFSNPRLAATLRELAGCPPGELEDWLAEKIDRPVLEAFGPGAGGRITAEDIKSWKPELRTPLEFSFSQAKVYTNPAPSFGGPSIRHTLRLFEEAGGVETAAGSPARYAKLAAVFQSVSQLRAEDPGIFDQAAADELFSGRLQRNLQGARSAGSSPEEPQAPGSTAHISVIDADGNAAGITLSHGEGNGCEIPGTGILMNNFLGEEDLFPAGLGSFVPGRRLSTMMAPTVIEHPSGAVSVLGSGGANRIRTAISQVACGLIVDELRPAEAVSQGRIHVENEVLSAESFAIDGSPESLAEALRHARELDEFKVQGLFFGGVHLAHRENDGTLVGAGDSRRNGVVSHVV